MLDLPQPPICLPLKELVHTSNAIIHVDSTGREDVNTFCNFPDNLIIRSVRGGSFSIVSETGVTSQHLPVRHAQVISCSIFF